ncbi:MAG: hypothetical protein ABII80_02060 [bacterium]
MDTQLQTPQGTVPIETSSLIPRPPSRLRLLRLSLLVLLPLSFLSLVLYFVLLPPTPQLSPLAYPSTAPLVRQSLTEPDKQPLAYYLAGSQEYLKRARETSRALGQNQTESDKRKILAFLNQSLSLANNAVLFYPDNPEGYLTRASLFETLAVLDPSATQKASSDRALAARLGKTDGTPIAPSDLIEYAPLEEASLLDRVAIALPGDETVPLNIEEKDNTTKGSVVIPTGQTEITISSPEITPDRLVYFTPTGNTQNETLTMKSKNTCAPTPSCTPSFTLSLSAPLPHNLSIDWWIVK